MTTYRFQQLSGKRERGNCQYYAKEANKSHENMQVRCCGFVIRSDEPHLGTSPDGRVVCDCGEEGVLEIKCPYTVSTGKAL